MSDDDKGIKAKNPDTYSGGNRDLDRFLSQCQIYFMLKPKDFKTQMEKVLFAGSHLRGPAADWFTPFIMDMSRADKARQETKLMFHDYRNFEQGLQQLYGSRDRQQLAIRQLQRLKQNGPASQYTATFRRLALDTDFNDSALRNQYYLGLRDTIKDELTRGDKPENLEELIERVLSIDERFFERQLERGRVFSTQERGFQPQGQGYHQQRNGYQGQQQRRDDYGSRPMDLSATRGPLSQKDRDHRMKNNLCLYCGKPGHRARECKAKQRQAQLAATYEYDPEGSDNDLPHYLKATRIEIDASEFACEKALLPPSEPPHAWLSWIACYDDDCQVHYSAKIDAAWFPRKPRRKQRKASLETRDNNDENYKIDEYDSLAATIREQHFDTPITEEMGEDNIKTCLCGTQERHKFVPCKMLDFTKDEHAEEEVFDTVTPEETQQIDMDGSYIRIDQQEVMSPNGVITTWEEVDGTTRLYFRTVQKTDIDDLIDNYGTKWLSPGSCEYKEMLKDNAARRRSNGRRRSQSLPPRTPSDSPPPEDITYMSTSSSTNDELEQ